MSKYEPLWRFLQTDGSNMLELSFDGINEILGFEINHSFLNHKKEAVDYGYEVDKISMKGQTVNFSRNNIKDGQQYINIFDKYIKEENPEHWIDMGFADFMWHLGFEMDCYKSFEELYPYPSDERKTNQEKQDWILSKLKLSSTQIVGNYIFSRFRYLTHWCDYGYDETESTYFFPKAFAILEDKMVTDNIERIPVKK